jgi:hypothetical protein
MFHLRNMFNCNAAIGLKVHEFCPVQWNPLSDNFRDLWVFRALLSDESIHYSYEYSLKFLFFYL